MFSSLSRLSSLSILSVVPRLTRFPPRFIVTANHRHQHQYQQHPHQHQKRERGRIPKTLRIDVWNHYFGEDRGSGPCPVCSKKITQLTFQCCHIVADSKGGSTTLKNLIPGCDMCNQSMGTQNLFEFKSLYYPDDHPECNKPVCQLHDIDYTAQAW